MPYSAQIQHPRTIFSHLDNRFLNLAIDFEELGEDVQLDENHLTLFKDSHLYK